MNIESPTETDALNSLDKLSSILKNEDSDCKYVDHINLIKNYIKDVEKQRQEKRDLELKEIYSEIIEEYYIKREELIKNLKEFINKNSLFSKEFLTGKNSTDFIRPFYYINDKYDAKVLYKRVQQDNNGKYSYKMGFKYPNGCIYEKDVPMRNYQNIPQGAIIRSSPNIKYNYDSVKNKQCN